MYGGETVGGAAPWPNRLILFPLSWVSWAVVVPIVIGVAVKVLGAFRSATGCQDEASVGPVATGASPAAGVPEGRGRLDTNAGTEVSGTSEARLWVAPLA